MSDSVKSKTYWGKSPVEGDPFEIPKRISKGILSASRAAADADQTRPTVRYLWIFVTEEGLQRRDEECQASECLQLDDWLNVIDESASLGAEWLVVYVGAALAGCPEVWTICEWAQQQHRLRVGIHVSESVLSGEDCVRLGELEPSLTYVIADESVLPCFESLKEKGVGLCRANVREDERRVECTNPENIVCVGIDGRLFTCGLVLREEHYNLGSVLEKGIDAVMKDKSLPHAVPDTGHYSNHGCDGCPSHVAHRAVHSLPQ